ncbi:MAG: hypothetical protein KDD78_07690, partial [Caldilineaceae bacterium]|nr:hypothetical protein [Caldilineaceae bacterium]
IQAAIDTARASQTADSTPSPAADLPQQEADPADTSQLHKPAFGHFLKLIADPAWTGFLILHCPLDYSKLPADVATLLGGIRADERLHAHHVGVTINRPRPGTPINPIESSSLFAVIYYENQLIKNGATYDKGFEAWRTDLEERYRAAEPVSTTDFETLRLEVLFENSKQQLFTTRLALTTPLLFGGAVQLEQFCEETDSQGANTIVVDGRQIRHPSGPSSLIFAWHAARIFGVQKEPGMMSALQAITFGDLHLRPVSVETVEGIVTAKSIFEYQCDLDFFDKKATGLDSPLGDLFSYDALRLEAYGLRTRVDIPVKGEPARAMVEDLSGARIDVGACRVRAHSLVASLPLHPSNVHKIDKWATEAAGGWWVKGVVPPDAVEPLPQGAGYSVEFDFPMGGTGGQVKTPAKVTARLCLAWAAKGRYEHDDHGVWFG